MLSEDDFKVGQIALRRNFVSKEQLEQCILELEKLQLLGNPKKLDKILLEKEIITPQQYQEIRRTLGKNRLGNYEILEKIAQGSTSTICKATHIQTQQIVALKILKPELQKNSHYLQSFLEEAKALSLFSHPNIVRCYEIGKDKNLHFIARELIEGLTLSTILQQQKTLAERYAIEITIQLAEALRYIHSKNYLHQDLRPNDIMVSQEDEVKLLDLGMLKFIATPQTTPKHLLPPPYYLSPEQAANRPDIDNRSDIYSLGANFYHMLTGHPPFLGKNHLEIRKKHIVEPLKPVREINPNVSSQTAAVVEKMLRKSPKERYQSAEETLHALKQLLHPSLELTTQKTETNLIDDSLFDPDILSTETSPTTQSSFQLIPALKQRASQISKFVQAGWKKFYNAVQKTRWDLLLFLALLGVFIIGFAIFYKVSSVSKSSQDPLYLMEKCQQAITAYDHHNLRKILLQLRQSNTQILDEDLIEILTSYYQKVRDRIQQSRKQPDIDDLKQVNINEVLKVLNLFKIFNFHIIHRYVQKYQSQLLSQLEQVELKKLQNIQKKFKNYIQKKQYRLLETKYKQCTQCIFTPLGQKKLKNIYKDIQPFLTIYHRFQQYLSRFYPSQPNTPLKLYFKDHTYMEIELNGKTKNKWDYFITKTHKFHLNNQLNFILSKEQKFSNKPQSLSTTKFLQKLHPIYILQIVGWINKPNLSLKFLLAEPPGKLQAQLLQRYLNQIQDPSQVNPSLYQAAKQIVTNQVNQEARKIFFQSLQTLWKKNTQKKQKLFQQLKNLPPTPWLRHYLPLMQKVLQTYQTFLNLLKKKNWQEMENFFNSPNLPDLLDQVFTKNSFNLPHKYRERLYKQLQAAKLWLKAKNLWIKRQYPEAMKYFQLLQKKYQNTHIYKKLKWQILFSKIFCQVFYLSKNSDPKAIKHLIVQSLSPYVSTDLLQQELSQFYTFSQIFQNLFSQSLPILKRYLYQIQKLNKQSKTKFFQVYFHEIQSIQLLLLSRIALLQGQYQKSKNYIFEALKIFDTPLLLYSKQLLNQRKIPPSFRNLFQNHQIYLSHSAKITIQQKNYHWQIHDPPNIFNIYARNHKLHVYGNWTNTHLSPFLKTYQNIIQESQIFKGALYLESNNKRTLEYHCKYPQEVEDWGSMGRWSIVNNAMIFSGTDNDLKENPLSFAYKWKKIEKFQIKILANPLSSPPFALSLRIGPKHLTFFFSEQKLYSSALSLEEYFYYTEQKTPPGHLSKPILPLSSDTNTPLHFIFQFQPRKTIVLIRSPQTTKSLILPPLQTEKFYFWVTRGSLIKYLSLFGQYR